MDVKKASDIKLMINKQCSESSLINLCKSWGITTEEYKEYLDGADKQIAESPIDMDNEWFDGSGFFDTGFCPDCQGPVAAHGDDRYCHRCGKKLSWKKVRE